jgi:hypothetical protein
VIGSDQRFRRICLAGIAAVSLVLVSACGSPSRDVRRGADLANGVGSSRLETEALYYWFPATGAQAASGARYFGIVSSLRDGPMASCMANHGVAYTKYSAAQYAASFVLNADLPDLQVISRTGRFVPDSAAVHMPNPGMARAKVRAYGSDLRTCATRIASSSYPDPDQSASGLRNQWGDILSSAESSTKVRATLPAFESCTEHAGVPPSVFGKAGSDSSAAFGVVEAWIDGPISRARTAASQHIVERHWTAVFVRCARPVVGTLNPLLATQQKAFFQQHARQIHELTKGADRYVSSLRSQDVPTH